MKKRDGIVKRQKGRVRFRNEDMDFMFTWALGIGQILGYAPTQALRVGNAITDGDPDSWCDAFAELGRTEAARARLDAIAFSVAAKGQAHLGAAYAYRMALQYADVRANRFRNLIAEMEREFSAGAEALGMPLRSVEIPFEGKSLPGYFIGQPGSRRPVVLMVGGGDTFREDLFYFAGYPGWKRDYDVLMVDLPGQGTCPDRGFPFRVDMYAPQKAAIDWLEAERGGELGKLAIYGVSGGGYFSAQCAASDRRVSAWIAATPIFDIIEVFRKEMGAFYEAPAWLARGISRLAGAVNRAADVSLAKYAWQFRTADMRAAMDGLEAQARAAGPQAGSVDWRSVACPCLFLVSEGEGPELIRQTDVAHRGLRELGVDVTRLDFGAAEGADSHCQLGNLRLVQTLLFDWLDDRFGLPARDPRLAC